MMQRVDLSPLIETTPPKPTSFGVQQKQALWTPRSVKCEFRFCVGNGDTRTVLLTGLRFLLLSCPSPLSDATFSVCPREIEEEAGGGGGSKGENS